MIKPHSLKHIKAPSSSPNVQKFAANFPPQVPNHWIGESSATTTARQCWCNPALHQALPVGALNTHKAKGRVPTHVENWRAPGYRSQTIFIKKYSEGLKIPSHRSNGETEPLQQQNLAL